MSSNPTKIDSRTELESLSIHIKLKMYNVYLFAKIPIQPQTDSVLVLSYLACIHRTFIFAFLVSLNKT